MQRDFAALCDFGGRRAGTPGEAAALDFAHARLAAIAPAATIEQVTYAGWRCSAVELALADGTPLACNALARLGSDAAGRPRRRSRGPGPRHAGRLRTSRARNRGPLRAGAPRISVFRGAYPPPAQVRLGDRARRGSIHHRQSAAEWRSALRIVRPRRRRRHSRSCDRFRIGRATGREWRPACARAPARRR